MRNRPSFPVVVPRLPVSVTTVTPTSGLPSWSVTLPVTSISFDCVVADFFSFRKSTTCMLAISNPRLVVFSMLPIASATGVFRAESETFGQVRFLDVVEERVSARFLDGADGLGKGNAGKTGCDPSPSPALAECYPPHKMSRKVTRKSLDFIFLRLKLALQGPAAGVFSSCQIADSICCIVVTIPVFSIYEDSCLP